MDHRPWTVGRNLVNDLSIYDLRSTIYDLRPAPCALRPAANGVDYETHWLHQAFMMEKPRFAAPDPRRASSRAKHLARLTYMSRVHTETRRASRAFPTIRILSRDWGGYSWKPLLAALLSVLLPGLGHLAIGERRRGLLFAGITGAMIATAIALTPRDPFQALSLLTQPRNLAGLLIVDVAILVFRGYVVLDAFRRALPVGTRSRRNPALLATAALLVAVTAAPHVAIGYYDLITYRFLDRTFNQDSSPRQSGAPSEVELTREIRLKDGVTPAAPPVVDTVQD